MAATAALLAASVGAGAAVALGGSLSGAIERADGYYQKRSDLENVRKALSIVETETARNPQNYAAWWRIAEYDCYLARHLPDDQEVLVLEDGVKAGKKAESLEPSRPEGHFWTGTNQGLLAEERGLWGGLHLIGPVKDEMQTVLKLDPDYQQDGAERVLGRLYYEAPFFKGGDKNLSVRLLEHCLERYPGNSLTMLYLADSYRSTGRRGDARKLLDEIIDLKPTPADAPELADNQAEARLELKKYFHQDG
ncbi:MAG: tetratricopeptide repeat protein [Terriglobia bacterium]